MQKESCRKVLDPELYNVRRTPLDSVKYFISQKLPQFGWGQTQKREVVLDIGCGPGGNTCQLLPPLFPQAEKIFAIDFLPDMIDFARNHNYHPLIEYSVANIENWSMVEQWRGQISKLISIHCIHWLKEKRRGFQNMFDLLKPGGEAALCFVMSAPVFAVTLELESNLKWSKFFKDVDNFVPDTHIKNHESSHYIKMLEDIGFDILFYEEEMKSDPFSSDEEYRESNKKVLDPELYSAKQTPLDHVKYFISEKLPQFGWGRTQEKEVVLDVGCGPGGNTFQLVLPLFHQAEKIFAIDFMSNMIEYARIHNNHPLIEYNVADIENWSTVEQWKGQISKLTAIHSFQWLKEKRRGLENMFELLKPRGEMAFCFVMESPLYASICTLENNPKWNKFLKDVDNFVSDDHTNKYESSRYKNMLEEIGFDILCFEEEVKADPFSSDEEYRDFFASICSLTSHVPSHLREDFKDDLFQEMLNLNGRDSNGRPVHRANIIEVVVRKKELYTE